MLIAVISDSHGNRISIDKVKKRISSADVLLFLGDGEEDLREITEEFKGEVYAVRGNCDMRGLYPEERLIELQGKKIFMCHGHRYGVKYGYNSIFYRGKEVGADIVLFGHSHIPIIEEEDGVFKINQSIAIQDSVNMAIAVFNDKEYRAVSGKNDIEESCTLIPLGKEYFKSCKVNKLGKLGIGYNRVNDSEKKIFEKIHKLIKEKKLSDEGNLILYSKWEPCPSCYYVISQFAEIYTGINLKIMYYKSYGEK